MEAQRLAYCGLDCHQCPTYLATQAEDDEMRVKTATFLNKTYGLQVRAKDINCDGCRSESGRLLDYCRACKMKSCAEEKQIKGCFECVDAPCEVLILSNVHAFSEEARVAFMALR